MKYKTPWMATALALCIPVLAQAQTAPADARSPGAAPRYESAFTDYKPWKDISAGNWRAANEAVGAQASGAGHGSHTMNMPPAAFDQRANQRPAPPAPSPSAPHEGHQMQMPGGQK